MKTSQKILVFFAKILSAFYLRCGVYLLWSTIHRLTADRKWKDVVLHKYNTIEEAAAKMRTFTWIKDDASELFDAICTPQKVQAVGFDGSSPHGNDCDEEAIYLTNTLEVEGVTPHFFTVTWYDPEINKWGGHNVCLLESLEGWRYMDYGMPSKFYSSPREVAELVIRDYAKQAIMITACISKKNLFPVKIIIG